MGLAEARLSRSKALWRLHASRLDLSDFTQPTPLHCAFSCPSPRPCQQYHASPLAHWLLDFTSISIMKPTLLIYATREGHTRRISEHLCELLQKEQHPCLLVNAAGAPTSLLFSDYSSAILAASLHYGKFEPEMVAFVKQHVAQLENLPTLFLSVSNAERTVEDPHSTPQSRAGAESIVKSTTDRFLTETRWHPTQVAAAAGALPYSKYGILTRFMMKWIAKSTGAPTDTSKDYVFTDWDKLDRMVEEFESAVV